jgi:hypothetical protein
MYEPDRAERAQYASGQATVQAIDRDWEMRVRADDPVEQKQGAGTEEWPAHPDTEEGPEED